MSWGVEISGPRSPSVVSVFPGGSRNVLASASSTLTRGSACACSVVKLVAISCSRVSSRPSGQPSSLALAGRFFLLSHQRSPYTNKWKSKSLSRDILKWVGSHSLLRGIFLDSGIEPWSPVLHADSLLSEPPGESVRDTGKFQAFCLT